MCIHDTDLMCIHDTGLIRIHDTGVMCIHVRVHSRYFSLDVTERTVHSLFDVVHPAFPLPTAASPTVRGFRERRSWRETCENHASLHLSTRDNTAPWSLKLSWVYTHDTAPWTDGILDYSRTLQPVTIGLPFFGKAVKLSLLDVCHGLCTRCFTSDIKQDSCPPRS